MDGFLSITVWIITPLFALWVITWLALFSISVFRGAPSDEANFKRQGFIAAPIALVLFVVLVFALLANAKL